jgi:hypothetical protein
MLEPADAVLAYPHAFRELAGPFQTPETRTAQADAMANLFTAQQPRGAGTGDRWRGGSVEMLLIHSALLLL